jgi:hypothetical protein
MAPWFLAEHRCHNKLFSLNFFSNRLLESVFAAARHRTVKTKGALSQTPAKLMVFNLIMTAAKTWRRPKGDKLSPKVIEGGAFNDGIEAIEQSTNLAGRSPVTQIRA